MSMTDVATVGESVHFDRGDGSGLLEGTVEQLVERTTHEDGYLLVRLRPGSTPVAVIRSELRQVVILHYVEPVYVTGQPSPHFELEPWVQPRVGDLIDTRDVHAESRPVKVVVPPGTVAEDSPEGIVLRAPGRICWPDTWKGVPGETVEAKGWYSDTTG